MVRERRRVMGMKGGRKDGDGTEGEEDEVGEKEEDGKGG